MKDLLGIIGILVISVEIYLWLRRRWIWHVLEGKKKARMPRKPAVMRPKSELDCQDCVKEKGKKPVWVLLSDFLYAQVNTSYVERLNPLAPPATLSRHDSVRRAGVTIRQDVSKLTRRNWGPAVFASELVEHLEWWRMYYHFVRYHERLKVKLAQPEARKGNRQPKRYRRRTPATPAPRFRGLFGPRCSNLKRIAEQKWVQLSYPRRTMILKPPVLISTPIIPEVLDPCCLRSHQPR